MKNFSKSSLYLLVAVAMMGCGGGGDTSATSGASDTPAIGGGGAAVTLPGAADTAAACFNPMLLVEGNSYRTVVRATYSGQGTEQQVLDSTVEGSVKFNGVSATKSTSTQANTPDAALMAKGQTSDVSSGASYYSLDASTGSVNFLGFDSSFGVTPSEKIDVKTVYNPYIETRLSLKPGQSFDQSYSKTETISRSNGTTQSPIVNYKKNVLFVAIAPVTVPAGTFMACQFVETGTRADAASLPGAVPISAGVATIWRSVGSGLPLKSTYTSTAQGSISSTFELMSATINGSAVTQ